MRPASTNTRLAVYPSGLTPSSQWGSQSQENVIHEVTGSIPVSSSNFSNNFAARHSRRRSALASAYHVENWVGALQQMSK